MTLATELLTQHLLGALSSREIGVSAGLAAIAAGGAALSVPPLLQRVLLLPWREDRLGDLIPLDSPLDDGETLRCVDGTLVVTIELWGIDTHGLGGGERVEVRERKNELLFALAPMGVHQRWFVQRRRQAATTEIRPDAHPQRRRFVESWNRQFSDTFLTRHVLALSVPGSGASARARLADAVNLAREILGPFGIRVLSTRAAEDGYSDALSFWSGVANTAAGERFPAVEADIGQALASGPVTFDYGVDGRIEMIAGDRERHGFAVSVGTLPSETIDDITAGLLVLPYELTVVQHVESIDPAKAGPLLDWRERQTANTYVSAEARAQFEAARSSIAPGSESRLALCRHAAMIFAWGRTAEEARSARQAVREELRRQRMMPVDEVDDVPALWWSQWPSFDADAWMRSHLLMSRAVADFLTLERAPIGLSSCDWGAGAPLRCRTAQGTPYHLSLHENRRPEAVGHTVMFGRIGSGKTTLATMLAIGGLVQFPDLQVRYFDRHFGQYVAVTHHGGRYVRFEPPGAEDAGRPEAGGAGVSLQPFRRPLTPERRLHILRLLRLMAGEAGDSAEAGAIFDHMLRHLERLPVHQRSLDRLVQVCAPPGSPVRKALRPWLPGGSYGHIFAHGGDDRTGLEQADLVAFDMTAALDDSSLAPVIVADLAFEIGTEARLTARPGLIGLDEARALFEHAGFRSVAKTWLYELRKARQCVLLMFQSPGQVSPDLEMLLRTQTATHIFFRDSGTRPEDFARWGLTAREIAFIRRQDPRTSHMEYACLVKKPSLGESVVVDFGLRQIGDLALLFRSGAHFAKAAQEAQQNYPGDPQGALGAYLAAAGAIDGAPADLPPVTVHPLEQGVAA